MNKHLHLHKKELGIWFAMLFVAAVMIFVLVEKGITGAAVSDAAVQKENAGQIILAVSAIIGLTIYLVMRKR